MKTVSAEIQISERSSSTMYELDRYERDSGFRRTQTTRPAAPKEEPRPSEPEVVDTPATVQARPAEPAAQGEEAQAAMQRRNHELLQ